MKHQLAARRRYTTHRRRALTLVELVVVIAILVALSGLIIPMVQGLGLQTNSATNATVVDDVNRAIGIYASRFDAQPDRWDSLLNESGAIFGKVHPTLRSPADIVVQPMTLSAPQVASLKKAGISYVSDAIESAAEAPSYNNKTPDLLRAGEQVLQLLTTGTETTRRPKLELGFQGNQFGVGDDENVFIVLGLGNLSTIQGSGMTQVPCVQSADPTNHYSRVCCVYMIPSAAEASEEHAFKARYVGCFLPDGTTARDNISTFNNSKN